MNCQFTDDDFRHAIQEIVSAKSGQAVIIQVVGGGTLTGYAPLSVGRDYLRCKVAAGEGHKDQIVPLHSITCVR